MVLVSVSSLVQESLRLTEATCNESSIYFSCLPLLPVMGLGIGGLRQAPLNFTINSKPPSHVPAPKPPGRLLSEDLALE